MVYQTQVTTTFTRSLPRGPSGYPSDTHDPSGSRGRKTSTSGSGGTNTGVWVTTGGTGHFPHGLGDLCLDKKTKRQRGGGGAKGGGIGCDTDLLGLHT